MNTVTPTRPPHRQRILVVASYFYPKIGGLENYAHLLAKHLRQNDGYDVCIATSNYDGRGYRRDMVDGMTVHRLPIWFRISNTPINPLWYWSIKRIIAQERPDIIHIHAPVPYLSDVAAAAAGDIPVVLTYHAGSMRKGKWPVDFIVDLYEKVFLSRLFKRADAIVAISQTFARTRFPQYAHKTHFIPTGVDLRRFHPTPLPQEGERITYVGRIEHTSSWKGIDQLLKAFAIVHAQRPQATLEIVGDGDAVAHYRARASAMGLGESVHLPGSQIGPALVHAYERASVVVLPSTSDSEAFSVALVEAMACGRPLIGTAIGGTPQVITDGENGLLVPPNDSRALALAIERVLSDRAEAQRMGENGARRAQSYSWDIQAKKYDALFRDMPERRRRPRSKITFIISGSVRSNFSYRALTMARLLHSFGYEVSIIAPRADKYNNFTPERIREIDGVAIHQPFQFNTRHRMINLIPYLFSVLYRVLREKPDLIYIYKPTPITIQGLALKLLFGTPAVLDMDDIGSEVMRIEGQSGLERMLVAWCERVCARFADRFVVVSTYLRDMYARQYPQKPILMIPNGVEHEWFSSVVTSTHPKRLVFMGNINRTDILTPLFQALPAVIRAHPDMELRIIGDGTHLSVFHHMAEELGVTDHVVFVGWLDLEIARTELLAGDIGYTYMPDTVATRAASNMKVPQYMARGVVPLVSDIGDLPATVDNGRAGYICRADDVASLTQTLIEALGDQHRGEKSERAREFALAELGWNDLARDFDRWMSSPLDQSR